MKRVLISACILAAYSCGAWAQLTTDQKVLDFQVLSSLFAKQYAPYEWKKQVYNVDLLQTAPWLDKVRQTKDDLTYYTLLEQYVASLHDAHSAYFSDSDFEAYLGFYVDIYDGKYLVDYVDRSVLSSRGFPFQIGDELVSVDGRTADDYVNEYSALNSAAFDKATRRFAAQLITDRFQELVPETAQLGNTATVVIRRQSGNLETYTITWLKFGTPVLKNGPVPSPQAMRSAAAAIQARRGPGVGSANTAGVHRTTRWPLVPASNYLHPLRHLSVGVVPPRKGVINFDSPTPVFAVPSGFVQRLGKRSTDFFFSGTYIAGGKRIGFIRIADFEPVEDFNTIDQPEAQFDSEISYMEKNTDALVIDLMSNPGGFVCYAEDLMSRLMSHPFWGAISEFRPTLPDVQGFADDVESAIEGGAEQWQIDLLKGYAQQVTSAYQENRGMTGPLPLCGVSLNRDPNTDANGNLAVYDKPVMLLTDETSFSAAETFSAMFQDANRGKIFGFRTAGAGGTVFSYPSGFYSEGTAYVTQTLVIRANPVVTSDFPAAPLVENIGVRPDVVMDYMTKDNLLNQGRTFVDAFTQAVLGMLQ